MTGYQSKKKAASAKTIDEVNWADHEPDGRRAASVTYNEVADTMNALRKGNFSQKAAAEEVGKLKLYTTPPQPALEQNFCPRCGKRTKDIHTCTPPQENT